MKLNTRPLKAEEIKARVAKVNKGGVKILLWKSSLADLNILDECLDPTDYSVAYPADGRCQISIWDNEKSCWVTKEGIGEGISPKTIANDALARAGTAWGIGRELYTATDIFIFKDKLKTHKIEKDESGKDVCSCYDEFKVLDVKYQHGVIAYLKIGIAQYGEVHDVAELSFSTPKQSKPIKLTRETVEAPKLATQSMPACDLDLPEDEIILIGSCRGKKFGEVKGTAIFNSFLNWAKSATTNYSEKTQAEQFARLQALARATV